jgi:hypothetical protein
MAMKWYLHSCPVCGGDLHDDLEDKGWVTCFMCARSFNGKDVLAVQRSEREIAEPVQVREAA